MLLQFIFRKRRKAVSPVVSTILMVTLSIAAAAVVVGVLSSIENRANGVDTDTNIGNSGTISSGTIPKPGINITSIQRDGDLEASGIQDYVKIKVDVTNTATQPLYVFDIDVIVYGLKLDEISQWQITDATGAITTTSNGQFGGFQQEAGETIRYTAELLDIDSSQSRIPANASFIYEVIYGQEKGIISGSVQKEKISEVIFSPVFFRVGILHHGSSFTTNDAATQYESTLKSLNGTNRIFFQYDRSVDTYDYLNSPGSIDGTVLKDLYDFVIVDVWAVPSVISSEILEMHQNNTKLIFYGGLENLGSTRAEILAAIDIPITEQIIGVTPNLLNVDPLTIDITAHSYQFFSGSSVLSGLDDAFFEEVEDDSYISGGNDNQSPGICGVVNSGTGVGDIYGFNIADFVGSSQNFIQYGQANYDFQVDTGSLTTVPGYPKTSALLVEKFNTTAFSENDTQVYSFIWKHNNDLAPVGADLTETSHLSQIRINMIGGVTGESTRTFTYSASSSIDAFNIQTGSQGSNKLFDMTVSGTINNADVVNGSLTISVNMPEYSFHDCNPSIGNQQAFGSLVIGSQRVVTDQIIVVIEADSIVTVDISNYYTQTIPKDTTFTLELGMDGTELFKISSDETVYDWVVTVKTGSGTLTSKTYQRAIDSALDQQAPTQVTGLSSPSKTDTSIDLTWTASTDNVGVTNYEIFRNGVSNANVSNTAYTDLGLNPSTQYTYYVVASDAAGNEAVASSSLAVTTDAGSPPTDVSSLTATAISSTRIDLSWSSVTNVDGYRIYRDSSLIFTLTNGSTSYHDIGLTSSTLYSYEVYAYNNTVESVNPATDSATTLTDASTINIYVSSISVSYVRQQGNDYFVDVTVIVLNETGSPVQSVVVDLTGNFDGNAAAGSGITGADGSVTIRMDITATRNRAVTVTVSSLTLSGYNWDTTNPSNVTSVSDPNGPTGGVSNP